MITDGFRPCETLPGSAWHLPNMGMDLGATACSLKTGFCLPLPSPKSNFLLFACTSAHQHSPNQISTRHSACPFKLRPLSNWIKAHCFFALRGSWSLPQSSCAPNKGLFHPLLFMLLLLYCAKEKPINHMQENGAPQTIWDQKHLCLGPFWVSPFEPLHEFPL